MIQTREQFDLFVRANQAQLTRALALRYGADTAGDACANALAYAWEHWDTVRLLANPRGYLFRVAQSSARSRKAAHLPEPASLGVPHVEPDLIPALLALPEPQRVALWLVYGCEWTYAEAAEALGIGTSTVGTHLQRGLAALRRRLRVETDA